MNEAEIEKIARHTRFTRHVVELLCNSYNDISGVHLNLFSK
jgi:hypothetical protein